MPRACKWHPHFPSEKLDFNAMQQRNAETWATDRAEYINAVTSNDKQPSHTV